LFALAVEADTRVINEQTTVKGEHIRAKKYLLIKKIN
jgi:hypothetical protein